MSDQEYDEQPIENLTSKGKADRKKKIEIQRRIYELKEKQRLKQENQDIYDYDDD